MSRNLGLLGAAAGLLALSAAAWPVLAGDEEGDAHAAKVPQFAGYWVRTGEPMFEPIPGEAGQPIARLQVDSKDAEEIMAGNWANPVLLPWARDIVKKNAEDEIALKHVYQADDSCWPVTVPAILNMREAVQWLQTEDRITLLYQRDHQIRRIWLNQPHSKNLEPSWYGESVGHFEGDTLVVDTTGIKVAPMSFVDPFGTPHTDKLHVVERYRVVPDKTTKALEVTIKVEDPGTFAMPWSGRLTYHPNRAQAIEEVICEENNNSFDGMSFGPLPEEKGSPF
uniref:Uncharacterized protein n=1 Tax=uncultured bacterium BLR9 TaxID=506525 RepID=C0INA5_9BACT|nr:hypothetical protein AKSOIL_0146 [uncultured bacterium BLR9]